METTEIIHNALEWANKRLELQGEPITENQRNYIVFALRQQLTIPPVVEKSESGRFYSVKEIETIKEECYQDGLEDGRME